MTRIYDNADRTFTAQIDNEKKVFPTADEAAAYCRANGEAMFFFSVLESNGDTYMKRFDTYAEAYDEALGNWLHLSESEKEDSSVYVTAGIPEDIDDLDSVPESDDPIAYFPEVLYPDMRCVAAVLDNENDSVLRVFYNYKVSAFYLGTPKNGAEAFDADTYYSNYRDLSNASDFDLKYLGDCEAVKSDRQLKEAADHILCSLDDDEYEEIQ